MISKQDFVRTKLLTKAPTTLGTDEPQTQIDPVAYVSVQHCGTIKLELSNATEWYRLVRRNPHGSWAAVRLERDRLSANFQGNPKWPSQVLEKYRSLSKWLGLSDSSNDDYCILPLPHTINVAIRSLFAKSRYDVVPLFGFSSHMQKGSKISDRDYVNQFIDQREIPMANLYNRDSIHDWSYHFLTLLFPEYLENIRLNLELIRQHIGKFKGTTCYSWNYYGHKLDSRGMMTGSSKREHLSHADAVYRQMAISLDVSSAKIIQFLMLAKQGLLAKCQSELEALQDYVHGTSPLGIRRILWLESKSCELFELEPAIGHRTNYFPSDIMSFVWNRLEEMEKIASFAGNESLQKARERAFKEVLSQLDHKFR